MEERVIDAKDAIVGRIATVAAKAALLGDKVSIINCEKAVISGTKKRVFEREEQKRKRGIPAKGPFVSRLPDRFVRRIIRGMLPYKQSKGSVAYKNIMCYRGIPEEFKDKKAETPQQAKVEKLRGSSYVTIEEICKYLGK